jgi:Arc/MetJ-type ribon-helix-helix transcriptional regulator
MRLLKRLCEKWSAKLLSRSTAKSVSDIDRWVLQGRYPNRSRALQSAVDMLVERERRNGLARELAKLNRAEEQRLAEEGLGDESWPPY